MDEEAQLVERSDEPNLSYLRGRLPTKSTYALDEVCVSDCCEAGEGHSILASECRRDAIGTYS